MGYHVLDPAEMEPSPDHPCDRRSVTEAAGLSNLALATYDLAPGEDLARHYHYHEQREEAFYVLAGTLHVETPGETFTVPAGQFFVVEPDSPIRPFNPETADGPTTVVGVGAPTFDPGRPYEPAE